ERLMRMSQRAMAESHRAHFVSLHVRMSNIAALRLYRDTLGFEVEKVESGYYADGEDAYAMRLNLQNMWLDWKAIEKKDADNNKEKNGDEEGNEDEGEEVGELGKKDAEKMIRVKDLLQPAPGLASYKLGQKTIISEHYAQIVQGPIYIVHDMTGSTLTISSYNFDETVYGRLSMPPDT
ncbi:hypothetical protein VN97_g10248, partial [Penicillium thymicola]